MFNKKDYLKYFQELYEVELGMKQEMVDLLKIMDQPEAIKIAEKIKADEVRHAKIVKDLMKLI